MTVAAMPVVPAPASVANGAAKQFETIFARACDNRPTMTGPDVGMHAQRTAVFRPGCPDHFTMIVSSICDGIAFHGPPNAAPLLAIRPGTDQLLRAHANQIAKAIMPDTLPIRWRPDRRPDPPVFGSPRLLTAMRRGVTARCPACGQGHLFIGWLRVVPMCFVCAAPLGEIRADDAPPYFTVFIVAHIAIGALVALERAVVLSIATEMAIFLPGTLALTLALIRPVKGATVGLMMKLGLMKPPDESDD